MENGTRIMYALSTETYASHPGQRTSEIMNIQASKEAQHQGQQSTTRIQVMEDGSLIIYILFTKTYHCHPDELTGEMINVQAEGVYEAAIVNIPVENLDTSDCPYC